MIEELAEAQLKGICKAVREYLDKQKKCEHPHYNLVQRHISNRNSYDLMICDSCGHLAEFPVPYEEVERFYENMLKPMTI